MVLLGFVLIYLKLLTTVSLRDVAAYQNRTRGTLRVNADPPDAGFLLLADTD